MIKRLMCAAFGHNYVVERVLNHGARKVGCTRCGKHWAMHDETRSFVLCDGDFEAMYAPGGILAAANTEKGRKMKKTLGQIAHEAGEKAGGWSRKWEHLGDAQRAEWEAIAEAVAEQVKKKKATAGRSDAERLR